MARLAHHLAMASPLVTADVIDVTEFPELADRYQVRSVPKTVINDRVDLVGALTEAKFLSQVKLASTEEISP